MCTIFNMKRAVVNLKKLYQFQVICNIYLRELEGEQTDRQTDESINTF